MGAGRTALGWRQAKSAIEVGDARIEFLAEGAGDPVVLIPGGGIDASYFADLARAFVRSVIRQRHIKSFVK